MMGGLVIILQRVAILIFAQYYVFGVFSQFEEAIPDGIFDPLLAQIVKEKFVSGKLSMRDFIFLEVINCPRFGGNQRTVLEWDAATLSMEFPKRLPTMTRTFHKTIVALTEGLKTSVLPASPADATWILA